VSEASPEDKHSDHKFCKQIQKLPALSACQYAPLFEEEGVEIAAAGRLIVKTPVENNEVDSSVLLDDIDFVSFDNENGCSYGQTRLALNTRYSVRFHFCCILPTLKKATKGQKGVRYSASDVGSNALYWFDSLKY
jgi:hypothetical protein